MNEQQKEVLHYAANIPEWQTALIYEQLAVLNRSASALSQAVAQLEQGFADSVLRPDRYYVADRDFRKDCNTGLFQDTASSLSRALAALELLAALSDSHQQDLRHSVSASCDFYYNDLKKLCLRHGYTEGK